MSLGDRQQEMLVKAIGGWFPHTRVRDPAHHLTFHIYIILHTSIVISFLGSECSNCAWGSKSSADGCLFSHYRR